MFIIQLILHSFCFILSVKGCISFGNSVCRSRSWPTLGGQLVFTARSGQHVLEPPSWTAGRKIVFVTDRFPLRRTFGLGRGRIWTGKRGCRDSFCQHTDFEDLKALSNIPYYSEKRSPVLEFSDVTPTSINVTWPAWDQSTDIGSCPITEYQIQFNKVGETQFRRVSAGLSLSYHFENLTENTEYEFRVIVFRDHPTHGEGPPSRVQTVRTLTNPPSYPPDDNVIQFSDITPTSIRVSWRAWDQNTDIGSGPVSEYQIQMRQAGENQFRTISVGLSLSYLFENLTADTDYEFRVVLFRDHPTHGEGPPCRVETNRTSTKPPAYPPGHNVIQFSNITPTSIRVSWRAWDQTTDIGSGPVSEYQIQIREAGENQFRTNTAGLGLSYLFENLTADTDYEFRVILFRNHPTHGEGPPSRVQTKRTLTKPPSYTPDHEVIQFSEITPTSIRVNWRAWDQTTDLGSGPISEYQIQIREAGETQFRTISARLSLSYLFENLTANTDYEFRVILFRDHPTHGEGPPSRVQTKRTLTKPPSYPPDDNIIQFSNITPTSIRVSWRAWEQTTDIGSGPISEYQIQIREAGENQFRTNTARLSLYYLFENLTADTDYEFRVILFRNHPTHGEGPPSRVQTKRTLTKPPSYPPDDNVIQFSDITPTSIRVNWRAWDQNTDIGSGPISEYQIQFREAGETQFRTISAGLSLSYLFENLTANTDYEFRVVLFRDHPTHGEGPPSRVQTKRTLTKPPSYPPDDNVIQFSDATPTSIRVSWRAWDQTTDIGSGPISEYQIQIREAGENQFRTNTARLSLYYLFENLTADTDYEFRVILFRNHPTHEEGPPSRVQRERTLPKESPYCSQSKVASLQFSDVTPTSITVSWPAWNEETDFECSPIVEYKVQFREGSNGTFNEVSVGLGLFYQFLNLTENTEYEFRVVIVRDHPDGEGPPSMIQTRTTPRKMRDKDLILHLESSSKFVAFARLEVSWDISDAMISLGDIDQTLTVERKDFDGCENSKGNPEAAKNLSLSMGDRSRVLKGKKPNSIYEVTLTVRYSTGDWYSRSSLKRTAETSPTAAPSNITARRRGRLLHFKWAEPPCGNRHGKIVRYDYVFQKNGHEMRNMTPLKQKYINNMSSEDRYSFKVRAYTSEGHGPYSELLEGIFGQT